MGKNHQKIFPDSDLDFSDVSLGSKPCTFLGCYCACLGCTCLVCIFSRMCIFLGCTVTFSDVNLLGWKVFGCQFSRMYTLYMSWIYSTSRIYFSYLFLGSFSRISFSDGNFSYLCTIHVSDIQISRMYPWSKSQPLVKKSTHPRRMKMHRSETYEHIRDV